MCCDIVPLPSIPDDYKYAKLSFIVSTPVFSVPGYVGSVNFGLLASMRDFKQ